MKKHGYASLLICGLLVGLAASAQAQSKIKVTVPFDFTVGKTLVHAGEYVVQPASSIASEVLVLRDSDGRGRFLSMGIRVEANHKATEPRLVFHRYGDRYFLWQVWLNAGDAGREIPPGSLERELAKERTAPELVAVLAQSR